MCAGDRSEIKHTPDITEKNISSLRTKVKDYRGRSEPPTAAAVGVLVQVR
jgi:hypothetical protein